MKREIFCLFSGGLKSAGNLWYVLSNPKYDDYIIHIHHIKILNYKNNHNTPIKSVTNILNTILSKFKHQFIISENEVNFNCLPNNSKLPNDLDICSFIASQYISLNPPVKYILLGQTLDDDSNILLRFNNSLEYAKQLPTAPKDIVLLSPLKSLTIQQIKAILPVEIQQYTC